MRRFRIGAPGDALTAPLLDGLGLPPWSDRLSLRVYRGDAPLAADLDARRLDAACLDAARLLERLHEIELVPGLAVTTDGPAGYAHLLSADLLGAVRTVIADDSRSAAALLCRVLFAESGREIDVVDRTRHAASGAADGEGVARLVVGRDAREARASHASREPRRAPAGRGAGGTIIDLGAAWSELTGLPFVWRAWAVLPRALDRRTYAILHSARTRGMRRLTDGVAEKADGADGAAPVYRLGRREIEALTTLQDAACRHGLADPRGAPRLARLPGSAACADGARETR